MIIDLEVIKKILPHRPPFLFLQEVQDILPGQSGRGFLNSLTPSCRGMGARIDQNVNPPGVLALEMLAQTAAVVFALASADQTDTSNELEESKSFGLLTSVQAQFEHVLCLEPALYARVEICKAWGRFVLFQGEVHQAEKLIVSGKMSLSIS